MYVWDERDAYGEDAYIDDFASGDGYGGGAVSASGRSIRDRLLDLGRAAGVEAPPAAVLKELEAFAMAAGLGASAGSPADGVRRPARATRPRRAARRASTRTRATREASA